MLCLYSINIFACYILCLLNCMAMTIEIFNWVCRHLWPSKLWWPQVYTEPHIFSDPNCSSLKNHCWRKKLSLKTIVEEKIGIVLHFLCLCLRCDNSTAFPDTSLGVPVHPVWTRPLAYNSCIIQYVCIYRYIYIGIGRGIWQRCIIHFT